MFKRVLSSRFLRNVILVASGTAGAQAITMAFSPVITRFYGPEAFGVLGTFTAVLAVVTPISALTYPIAIVLPKDDDDARGIAKLSIQLAFFICLVFSFVIFVADKPIAKLLNLEAIADFLFLIPLAMFLHATQQVMQQWLIRKKQFKVSARVAVSQSLILNIAKTGVGFVHPAGAALVVLSTLGYALYSSQLWFGAKHWCGTQDQIHKPSKKLPKVRKLAREHRDFPMYRAPQISINSFSQSLPVLLLASFFGPAAAGFYSLGRATLAMPTTLLGKAISDVFYPRIAEAAHANENTFKLIMKATVALAVVGIFPFGIVFALGPFLFKFVFGSEWYKAGEYARWLSIWLFFAFINRPSVSAIAVLNLQGYFLLYEILSILLRTAALAIGFWLYKNDVLAIILFSLIGAILNVVLIIFTMANSKKNE